VLRKQNDRELSWAKVWAKVWRGREGDIERVGVTPFLEKIEK